MDERTGTQPADEPIGGRTLHLLEDVGERIGRSLSGAVERVRRMGDGLSAPDGGDTMERAEHLATRLGDRIGDYATMAGLKVRRAGARIREEAEDIRAEAGVRSLDRPSTRPEDEDLTPSDA